MLLVEDCEVAVLDGLDGGSPLVGELHQCDLPERPRANDLDLHHLLFDDGYL